jgi:hypothetical protein
MGRITATTIAPHHPATSSTTATSGTSMPLPRSSTPAARNLAKFGTTKPVTRVVTPEDQAIVVTVPPGITIGSTLTLPAHGTARRTGARTFLYTPDIGYVGPDTFTYQGANSQGVVLGTVDVTVTEVPPTARSATVDTTVGQAVTIDLVPLTTRARGNTVTFSVANPVHGTVTTTSAGAATFTPAPGFTGDGQFTYTVTDNHGGKASATVTVHVTGPTTGTTTHTTGAAATTAGTAPTASAGAATTPATASGTTTLPPQLAFTGTDDAAVGLAGATLVAGGGFLTALARRRRPRHPTWQHLRRS